MKSKKKSVRKRSGLTAGEVFGRMAETAKFFEYMAVEPGQNPWDLKFIGFHQVDEEISVDDGTVVVDGIVHCRTGDPVTIKGGDTVEVVVEGYTFLFRFYGEPRRIENIKDLLERS